VNVTTKSGTNALHGEGFYFVRDHSFAATSPGGHDYYLQRHQFGGKLGGPIVKDKLFFFLDGERTKQDAFAAVQVSAPLNNFSGGFSQPFREGQSAGQDGLQLRPGRKSFLPLLVFRKTCWRRLSVWDSRSTTQGLHRQHVVGLDTTTGPFSHSFRFSYLKFQNGIEDATLGNNSLPLCCTGAGSETARHCLAGLDQISRAIRRSNHRCTV